MKNFLLLLLLAAPLCLLAQFDTWPRNLGHSRFIVDTVQNSSSPYGRIQFLRFLPPDYGTAGTPHPLIIFLSGQGEIEKGNNQDWVTPLLGFALPRYLNMSSTTMSFTGPGGINRSFVVLIPQKHHELDESGIFQRQFPAYYVDAMLKYARDE